MYSEPSRPELWRKMVSDLPIGRREFLKWTAVGLALSAQSRWAKAASQKHEVNIARSREYKVAAIQMQPKLGDVEANLAQAEMLVREASKRGAEWIVLPEAFTSAAAFHEDMIKAIRPLDGAPARFFEDLARKENTVVGGSFLARVGDSVRNRFLLVLPDGTSYRHDKDFPSLWEACYYEGGEDDGVLDTPMGPVGAALCWEMIRSATARRMLGKVEIVLAGSTWWTSRDEEGADYPSRAINLQILQEAPRRLARMLGVPVVHASHAGPFAGFDSPELPDVPYRSAYLGETMITDAGGNILARLGKEDGAGVIAADVTLPTDPDPSEAIPERFWVPEQMPQAWKDAWERWLPRGEDYYRTVTLPYLNTGEMLEYVPPYLR